VTCTELAEVTRTELAEMLARWEDFRTLKWIDEVKCPELMLKQVEELLATA